MTVSTTVNTVDYTHDGVTVFYEYAYPFTEDADLFVSYFDASAFETALVLGVDYTVAGGGEDATGYATGSITLTSAGVVPTGNVLRIFRYVTETQNTVYPEGGKFPAKSHERGLDKAILAIQGLNARLNDIDGGVGGPATGNLTLFQPTVSDGQTVVVMPQPYTPGLVQMNWKGSALTPGVAFQAVDGLTVSLLEGQTFSVGDEVSIWAIAAVQSGIIPEAPSDDFTYGRKNVNWERVLNLADGGIVNGPLTVTNTVVANAFNGVALSNLGVATDYLDATGNYSTPAGGGGGIPEAPNDGFTYGRVSLGWAQVLPLTGGSISGALGVSGAFSSIGINDTSTAQSSRFADSLMSMGVSAAFYGIVVDDNTQGLNISGGNAITAGTNIIMYGGAHLSAGDFFLRNGVTATLFFDASASNFNFQGNSLTTTGAISTGASTAATYNGITLTTAGSAANYLDETGLYSVPAGGGGIPEAPIDGITYGRTDGVWESVLNLTDGGTVAGPLVTSSFTSRGIVDTVAIATRLTVENSYVEFGAVGLEYNLRHIGTTSSMVISGGSSSVGGSNLTLYGSGTTGTGDVLFRKDAAPTLLFDWSAGVWNFQTFNITTTGVISSQGEPTITVAAASDVQIERIEQITQAAYDLLAPPTATTQYDIVG